MPPRNRVLCIRKRVSLTGGTGIAHVDAGNENSQLLGVEKHRCC